MLVPFAVLTRIFSNSVANLYQKKASEYDSSLKVNLVSCFFMSVLCLIPAFRVDWAIYPFEFWLNVIIAGMLFTGGSLALIEALRIGELSVLAPINSYKSIVGLIGAFLILGEIPSLKDFVCVLFIVLGSLLVLNKSGEKFSFKVFLRRDVRMRFLALLCSGIEASFLKNIILMSDFKIALMLWCFSGFVCSVLIYLFKKEKFNKDFASVNYKNCFLIAVSLILMQLTTNYVFYRMEVGPALALFQLSSLVSLYFGYKFYNESNMLGKVIGTIIMISASVVILIG